MAKYQVRIEIDERECSLYEHIITFSKDASSMTNLIITKKVLPLGDILIFLDENLESPSTNPVVVIERKSFQDLFASIKDGRYQEQSYRLINTKLAPHLHNIIYLIEGSVALLKSEKEKALLYSTSVSLNLYKGFSLYRTTHIQESASFIYTMASKILRNAVQRKELPLYMFLRGGELKEPQDAKTDDRRSVVFGRDAEEPEVRRSSNIIIDQEDTSSLPPSQPQTYTSVVKIDKKENITPQNIGAILLCQIPGIQHITADQIMYKFKTIRNLIESLSQDPNCMDQIYMTTTSGSQRKLSHSIIQNIKKFLVDNFVTDEQPSNI